MDNERVRQNTEEEAIIYIQASFKSCALGLDMLNHAYMLEAIYLQTRSFLLRVPPSLPDAVHLA